MSDTPARLVEVGIVSVTMTAHDAATARTPAVAGSFYPHDPVALRSLVDRCLREAASRAVVPAGVVAPIGLLVPHAGLEYSGFVAAAAWRLLGETAGTEPTDGTAPTVVILGTNHSAWLDGVGVWDAGAWQTPLGVVEVDTPLATRIASLGEPFGIDRAAHQHEHSIEVQLPILRTVAPTARIVPLAVSAGTDQATIIAGHRLGTLLADLRREGAPIVLAISTDMAHYPDHRTSTRVTELLLPPILALDADEVAARERELTASGAPGLACGMCGIQPAVLGLAALAALGPLKGTSCAAATSADAGGPSSRTVGYLSVAWSAA